MQIFRVLFLCEQKHTGRFSNLHQCTFKRTKQNQNKFKYFFSFEVEILFEDILKLTKKQFPVKTNSNRRDFNYFTNYLSDSTVHYHVLNRDR